MATSRELESLLSPQNLVHHLRNRELGAGRGTHQYRSRLFYENICPSETLYDVESPSCVIRKFSRDGRYLVCFSQNHHALQVYRFNGASGPVGVAQVPLRTVAEATPEKRFAHFFTLVYERFLTMDESLCKDFCLFTTDDKHVILASSKHSQATRGVRRTPVSLTANPTLLDYTLYCVNLEKGEITDSRIFKSDLINLAHQCGMHLYKNLMGVLSLQDQCIYLFQIKDGTFVDLHTIGPNCYEDDDLELARYRDFEERANKANPPPIGSCARPMVGVTPTTPAPTTPPFANRDAAGTPAPPNLIGGPGARPASAISLPDPMMIDGESLGVPTDGTTPIGAAAQAMGAQGAGGWGGAAEDMDDSPTQRSSPVVVTWPANGQQTPPAEGGEGAAGPPPAAHEQREGFIMGIQHRLLAFIYRQAHDDKARKRFFSNFKQYASLVMWRFQFLDETVLLIKFGCLEGVLGRMAEYAQHTAFLAVYDLTTTRILGVHENTSEMLLSLYENFTEFFHIGAAPGPTSYLTYSSNNQCAREYLLKQKTTVTQSKNGGHAQAVKRVLWAVPCAAQSMSESPYFDQSLFSYDEKFISAADRPKPCVDYPIKFHSRRHDTVRFKVNPSQPSRANSSRTKRYATYIFHPVLPFAISVQYSQGLQPLVNFHCRS